MNEREFEMSSIIDIAIKRLSEQSTSERELQLFLEKEFANLPDLNIKISAVFKRLHELHLINDQRLAMNLAQHYAHKGDEFIARLLRHKGIAEHIIDTVLLSLDNENERALGEARKKLGVAWDDSEKAMNLLQRFLSGRSFSYTAINTVLGQLGNQNCCYSN